MCGCFQLLHTKVGDDVKMYKLSIREGFPWARSYMQFEGMVYQQLVVIHMGPNCAPLIADLFLYVMRGILCLTFTNLNSMTL